MHISDVPTSNLYEVSNTPYSDEQPNVQPQLGFNVGSSIPPYPQNPRHPMPEYPPAPGKNNIELLMFKNKYVTFF